MNAPERSILATPATKPRMVAKALASAADVVFLDLEDAVAATEKGRARQAVVAALREQDWGGRRRLYRVNGLQTPHFYRDVIDVVEAAGPAVDAVLLPKVDRPEDVFVLATLLRQVEAHLGLTAPIEIEVQIESALGLLNSAAIAAADVRVRAIVFGPGDYAASVGMPVAAIGVPDRWDAVYRGSRYQDAMHRILVAGRAAGIRVIDGPFADFRDGDGLRRSCGLARALGYDGKWCIHPDQIETVNDVFTPGADEVAWARTVIAAADTAARGGDGASAIGGTMIDAASIRLARTTLANVRSDADDVADPPPGHGQAER